MDIGFQEKLLNQDLFEEFGEEFTREMNRLQRAPGQPSCWRTRAGEARSEAEEVVESIMEGVPGSELKDELIAIGPAARI